MYPEKGNDVAMPKKARLFGGQVPALLCVEGMAVEIAEIRGCERLYTKLLKLYALFGRILLNSVG